MVKKILALIILFITVSYAAEVTNVVPGKGQKNMHVHTLQKNSHSFLHISHGDYRTSRTVYIYAAVLWLCVSQLAYM